MSDQNYSSHVNAANAAMGWNDAIENDGQSRILLEGDYDFTVVKLERGYFRGSEKMSPGNMAILTLQVKTENGTVNVRKDLILNRLIEFRISEFFRSIGLKKPGERLVMDWNKVVGKCGRAHFKPRTYPTSNGDERQTNDVKYFYEYNEKNFLPKNNREEISDDEMFH